jgi:hypothetical protein
MKAKGELTVMFLAMVIFVIVTAVVLFVFAGDFIAGAGRPISNVFLNVHDWFVGLFS